MKNLANLSARREGSSGTPCQAAPAPNPALPPARGRPQPTIAGRPDNRPPIPRQSVAARPDLLPIILRPHPRFPPSQIRSPSITSPILCQLQRAGSPMPARPRMITSPNRCEPSLVASPIYRQFLHPLCATEATSGQKRSAIRGSERPETNRWQIEDPKPNAKAF